jgi:cation/acetate symporter
MPPASRPATAGADPAAWLVDSTSASANPVMATVIFAAVVALALYLARRAGQGGSAHLDGWTGARGARAGGTGSVTGTRHGLALAGDHLCAASILGIAGAIAVHGHDGVVYPVGFVAGWLVHQLLVAESVRNTGDRTVGDVVAYRMQQRQVRTAAAVAALAISVCCLLAQLVGAGALVALLLGVSTRAAQTAVLAATALVLIAHTVITRRRLPRRDEVAFPRTGRGDATSWQVQAAGVGAVVVGAALLSVFLMGKFGFSMSALLAEAADRNALGERLVEPGTMAGRAWLTRLDFVSLAVALALGVTGLPHLLMRCYDAPDAVRVRRGVAGATWLLCGFYLATFVIGYGAAALVGAQTIRGASGGENAAVPLLALNVGGTVLLGVVIAVAFLAILAVAARLTTIAAASFAHDLFTSAIRRGAANPSAEGRVIRLAAFGTALLAATGAVAFAGRNTASLVGLALAVAASANLSTLVYSLYWRRFSTVGALAGCYGGVGSSMLLVLCSPVVSGTPSAVLPDVDFAWFPLSNPALVSVPLSFLLGALATVLGPPDGAAHRQAEMEVRALSGLGSA